VARSERVAVQKVRERACVQTLWVAAGGHHSRTCGAPRLALRLRRLRRAEERQQRGHEALLAGERLRRVEAARQMA
jgi:hypothetical protein